MYASRSDDILLRGLPALNHRRNIFRRGRRLRTSRPRGLVRPGVGHVANRVEVGKRRVGELHCWLDADEAVLWVEQRALGRRRLQALEQLGVGRLARGYHDEVCAKRSPVLQGDGDGLASAADGVAVLGNADAGTADEAVALSVFGTVRYVPSWVLRRDALDSQLFETVLDHLAQFFVIEWHDMLSRVDKRHLLLGVKFLQIAGHLHAHSATADEDDRL